MTDQTYPQRIYTENQAPTNNRRNDMTDQTYDKLDLAIKQLHKARSHFHRESYVSALRLAAAADETFVKALSHCGEQNALERKYEDLKPIHIILDGKPLSIEDFIKDENCAVHAVTRMESPSDRFVTLALEQAAYSRICRACENAERLGLRRALKRRDFQNYFFEYVIGLADPAPRI
jgi:hypothetical protein